FIPFTTETVWRWWQSGSVHRASWPTVAELGDGGDAALLGPIGEVLALVRRAKTEAKTSQKTAVASAEVTGSSSELAAVTTGRADLSEAGSVQAWSLVEGAGPLSVTVVLAPSDLQ
ncbi:MAG: valine--tRNA ligase, partial [Actinomycetes bacterium]